MDDYLYENDWGGYKWKNKKLQEYFLVVFLLCISLFIHKHKSTYEEGNK